LWLLWLVLNAEMIETLESVKPLEVKRSPHALLHAETAFPRPRSQRNVAES